MKRFSALILLFSILFFFFFIALVFLRVPFGLYPLMSVQDAMDLLTPLVLLPVYWLLYRLDNKTPVGLPGLIIFFIFAAFWVEGQGIHLGANSIGNLLKQKGMETGDIYTLTYFFDELLGHYLWHIGVVGLSALLIYRQWRNPFTEGKASLGLIIPAGIVHGFTYFLIIMEGNTGLFGVPFSVLAALFILVFSRKGMSQQPINAFFLCTYALAVVLFFIWGAMNGWTWPPIGDVIKF